MEARPPFLSFLAVYSAEIYEKYSLNSLFRPKKAVQIRNLVINYNIKEKSAPKGKYRYSQCEGRI